MILTSELVNYKQPKLERVDTFRADVRIPKQYRVTPQDYIRSGYDKGHMVPAGDASNSEEMFDTFLMTNMTPQEPSLNRKAWRELEHNIRGVIMRERRNTHVITGAVYSKNPRVIGASRVPVPSGYVKIAYFKSGIKAYYADNAPDATVHTISTKKAETLLGIGITPRAQER